MILEKEIPITSTSYYEALSEDALCFDIETTGLNKKYTHITVIGCGHIKKDKIIFRQWLLENPSAEKKMLLEFSDYLKSFHTILQFNGQAFDIPYVRERCLICRLPDPFSHMDYVDLYKSAKKLKNIMHLENCKQKTMEELFHIQRKDKISGYECISAYKNYLRSGNETAKNALLLHNEEDVLGLLKLSSLRFLDTLSDDFQLEKSEFLNADCFQCSFSLKHPLFFPISCKTDYCDLQLDGRDGILLLKSVFDSRKFFFSDYKNYFYLPEEDHAIHKSVGIYVDPDHRCKASKSNCYEKKEDYFFYQPKDILSPAFRLTYKDADSWIQKKVLKEASFQKLSELCKAYLSHLF